MNDILKTRKLVDGEYWEIKHVGDNYLVINTGQQEDQASGTTNLEIIKTFTNFKDAIDFLNNQS